MLVIGGVSGSADRIDVFVLSVLDSFRSCYIRIPCGNR